MINKNEFKKLPLKKFLYPAVFILFLVVTLIVYLSFFRSKKLQYLETSNITDRSITITWISNEESSSKVYYSKNNYPNIFQRLEAKSKNAQFIEETRNKLHYVTLSNLDPNTEYYFLIGNNPLAIYTNKIHIKTKPQEEGIPQNPIPLSGRIEAPLDANEKNRVILNVSRKNYPNETKLSTLTNSEGYWIVDVSNLAYEKLDTSDLIFETITHPDYNPKPLKIDTFSLDLDEINTPKYHNIFTSSSNTDIDLFVFMKNLFFNDNGDLEFEISYGNFAEGKTINGFDIQIIVFNDEGTQILSETRKMDPLNGRLNSLLVPPIIIPKTHPNFSKITKNLKFGLRIDSENKIKEVNEFNNKVQSVFELKELKNSSCSEGGTFSYASQKCTKDGGYLRICTGKTTEAEVYVCKLDSNTNRLILSNGWGESYNSCGDCERGKILSNTTGLSIVSDYQSAENIETPEETDTEDMIETPVKDNTEVNTDPNPETYIILFPYNDSDTDRVNIFNKQGYFQLENLSFTKYEIEKLQSLIDNFKGSNFLEGTKGVILSKTNLNFENNPNIQVGGITSFDGKRVTLDENLYYARDSFLSSYGKKYASTVGHELIHAYDILHFFDSSGNEKIKRQNIKQSIGWVNKDGSITPISIAPTKWTRDKYCSDCGYESTVISSHHADDNSAEDFAYSSDITFYENFGISETIFKSDLESKNIRCRIVRDILLKGANNINLECGDYPTLNESDFETKYLSKDGRSFVESSISLDTNSSQDIFVLNDIIDTYDDFGLEYQPSAIDSLELKNGEYDIVLQDEDENINLKIANPDNNKVTEVKFFYDTNNNGQKDQDEDFHSFYQQELDTVKTSELVTYNLHKGWNFLSLPTQKDGELIDSNILMNQLNKFNCEVEMIGKYESGMWILDNLTTEGGSSNSFEIEPKYGLLIKSKNECQATLNGIIDKNNYTPYLNKGWNLISYKNASNNMTAKNFIQEYTTEDKKISSIAKWNNTEFEIFSFKNNEDYGDNFLLDTSKSIYVLIE